MRRRSSSISVKSAPVARAPASEIYPYTSVVRVGHDAIAAAIVQAELASIRFPAMLLGVYKPDKQTQAR